MLGNAKSRLLLKQSVHCDGGMELSGIAVPGQAIGSDKRKLDGFPASNNLLHNQLFEIVRKNTFFSLYRQVLSILFVQIKYFDYLYGQK